MTVERMIQNIDQQWENKGLKTDWIGLEQAVKDVLSFVKEDKTSPTQALTMIDELFGAFLKRGHLQLNNKSEEYRVF